MKNRVIIVEPRGGRANVFSDYINLPLLGTLYLGTILKQAGYDVRILNENILGRDVALSDLDADYLLLSLLTPTAERGYDIAGTFRKLNPRAITVIGGIHPSFLSEEAASYADYVVTGEGEDVIVDLLRYGSDEKIIAGSRIEDLDRVPIPDFSLLANGERLRITPTMTSRGCPYDCNFCAVTEMFGRGYRMHSPERVIEELGRIRTRHVFIYDDNFAANPKRTHELLDRMIDRSFPFKWSTQVRADVTRDPELISKMQRAGCERVYIGFESINPATLEHLKKNQSPEDVRDAIQIFHKNNISIHGMFMFGSDEDHESVFQQTASFCRKHHLSSVQFMILTPLPGTAFFQRMEREGRLLHRMWQYYDGMHTVFRPLNFSPLGLQEGALRAFQDFYSYFGIMNDAINIFFETSRSLATSFISGIRIPSLRNSLVKLQAKAIIRRWKGMNQDYLLYLKRIKRTGAVRGG